MAGSANRKIVSATTSQLKRIVQFYQLTGTANGMGGLVNGGTWTPVTGLQNVPAVIKSWTPWQQWVAQQRFPGVDTRMYVRYRKSVPITAAMRVQFGNHTYEIVGGPMNYDEANTDIVLYLKELQATGTVR